MENGELERLIPELQITLPESVRNAAQVVTPLADWNRALETCLQNEQPKAMMPLAHVVLRQLPRHLPTYQRIVRAMWALKRWEEGEDWAKRLLHADPLNALAWRAVAFAAEVRGDRAQANAIWRRAFECDPYEPEIRAGVMRTTLQATHPLQLNLACLGLLYLRGQRWGRASSAYRALVEVDPRRLDFQAGLLIALWQGQAHIQAYQVTRQLQESSPYLLLGWAVADAIGDENDKALARQPLQSMDANGDYLRNWYGLPVELRPFELRVTEDEATLLAQTK